MRYSLKRLNSRSRRSWRYILAPILLILLVVVVMFGTRMIGASKSPVPQDVRKSLKFPVYYPAQNKLPAGYILDTTSFKEAETGVLVYVIKHGSQTLTVSEEVTPDNTVLDKFLKNYIPLHTELDTALGKAQLGAYGSAPNIQAVVSLPVNKGPWLILTAPSETNQIELQQIIQALVK